MQAPAVEAPVEQRLQRVWDAKAIGAMYEIYADDVRTAGGFGREPVIAETVQWLAAFPDLRLHSDAVVSDGGGRTSQRFTLTGRNTGWSVSGPPTGRRIVVGGLAE